MLTDEQKNIRTEFRKFLRVIEGQKGNMLNTIIKVAEKNLPELIQQHFRSDFNCIFDDIYSLDELLSISIKIRNDETILAGPFGYISSKTLDAYIRFYAIKNNIDIDSITSKEDINSEENEKERIEGRLTEIKVLHRQRNQKARQQCLEDSGYKCYVCGFDFGKAYGELGKGFLEVHHTKPIASYDEEHEIPQSELCALCSNCHAMVHRKKEILDVDELKRIYNSIKGNK